MKINNNILGIYISLALTGLTIIPFNSFKEKWLPIVIASALILLTFYFLIRFIKEKYSFKLVLSSQKSINEIEDIYKKAKIHGGRLFHTYLAPIESLQTDLFKGLTNNAQNQLSIKLLLYTDDPLILHNTIFEILHEKGLNIDIEIIVPDSIEFVPKFIWYVLPRINILSYYDKERNISTSSINVVPLSTSSKKTDGVLNSPTINFISNRKTLFNKIEDYFKELNYGHCKTYHSLSEYEKTKANLLSQAKYKSFIAHLLYLCNNPEIGILHVSLFGQYASYKRGIYKIGDLKIDYDIDLLLVCGKEKKEHVRYTIEQELKKLNYPIKIIWGPINEDFYGNRTSEKIYIDIELFEEGEKYYIENSLLGYSIIPSCLSIFMQNENNHRLYQLLPQPEIATEILDRFSIVLNNRKGLIDFESSVKKFKGNFDPVRVISHILRNTAWAITGHFEPTYDKMFEVITDHSKRVINKDLIGKVYNLVKHNGVFDYEYQHEITIELLNAIIKYLTKEIDEKTRANN